MSSLGSWELPEELGMVRDAARRFMKNEVRPQEEKLDHDAYEMPPEMLEPLRDKARKMACGPIRTPVEYGGAGLNLLGQAVVAEEASQCRMGAYVPACGVFGSDPPNAVLLGPAIRSERYAIPPLPGERSVFVASVNPPAGPIRRAHPHPRREEGRSLYPQRQKMWITGAAGADWGLVFARTGTGGRGGISCFIVDGIPRA